MRVPRLFTQDGNDPLKGAPARAHQDDEWLEYRVPRHWGRAAAEALCADVFTRAALPALLRAVPEEGVPEWLWRREADEEGLDGISAEWRYRHENDFAEAFARIAGGLAYHAWKAGLFDGAEDARAFRDEMAYMLLHQMAAPEIALLATAGLDWAYGLAAPFVPDARIANFSDALFTQDVAGAGIAVAEDAPQKDILKRLRLLGEKQALDGGGRGISVTLPIENVDSPAFANFRKGADIESISRALGEKTLETVLNNVIDACDRDRLSGFDPARNGRLMQATIEARRAGVPEAAVHMAIHYAQQGYEDVEVAHKEEEEPAACFSATLSVPDDFIESALTGHGFMMGEGGMPKRHYPAEKLWNGMTTAIWSSGEPAVFFRGSASFASVMPTGTALYPGGRGGFVFIPGTAAPAATLNLSGFFGSSAVVDAEKVTHAARLLVIALEASFAFARGGEKTAACRPVSIGVAGLSAALMQAALPYDSEEGRATAALVAALVLGAAQKASAEIAKAAGAFEDYRALESEYLQAVKDRASVFSGTAYMEKGLSRRPAELKVSLCPDAALAQAAKTLWAEAYAAGRENGFRHAHLTAMGTDPALQRLLGAQTRDIAPEAALVRFEGYFADSEGAEIYGKKLNPMAVRALKKMGHGAQAIDDISFYAVGHGTLLDAPAVNHETLREKGFHQAALDALEAALGTAQHIRYVFNKWTLGEDFCERMLGFSDDDLSSGSFDMLAALGFSEDEIDAANLYCCGAMTLEGAPHVLPAQLPVFDCLAPAGAGIRRVSPEAQIRMQAAVEQFLSGAAFHTVGLGHYASVDDVQKLVLLGWELGVKRLSLYRDGCSLLHPVSQPVSPGAVVEDVAGEEAETRPRVLAVS